MPHDPNAFADMVAMTIKAALTPVLERMAGLDVRVTQALALEPAVTALRDRVVAVEAKAAVPVPTPEPTVDLTPVLERVAGLEAQVKQALAVEPSVMAIRDRVVAVEVKAAAFPTAPEPADVDFTPVTARIESLETIVDALKDRVLVTETKAALPALSAGPSPAEIELLIHAAVEPVTKTLSTIQERVAVVEARAPIHGPPGEKGANGADGKDGKDGANGADGVGFDDLAVEQVDERSVHVKAIKGDRVKTLGTLTFPVNIYRGVYVEGKSYERGDCVTWAGSEWHCNDATTVKPGDGLKAWTLKVKRGRDGRDGKDAETVPVVSVGSR